MRLALTVVSVAVLVACDDYQRMPTVPEPVFPPSMTAMALDESVGCIGGTTIELIKAEAVVETGRHDATCDPWYGGGVTFYKVTYGETVGLRASAAGYQTMEQQVVVKRIDGYSQGMVLFTLRRIQ